MARPRLAGLTITGAADLRAETRSGSTPRNGAGSMATNAAAIPAIRGALLADLYVTQVSAGIGPTSADSAGNSSADAVSHAE
jgi:hypothetical protein